MFHISAPSTSFFKYTPICHDIKSVMLDILILNTLGNFFKWLLLDNWWKFKTDNFQLIKRGLFKTLLNIYDLTFCDKSSCLIAWLQYLWLKQWTTNLSEVIIGYANRLDCYNPKDLAELFSLSLVNYDTTGADEAINLFLS